MRTTIIILATICLLSTSVAENVTPRPKVGLVLSGGGAKAAAHIAVLKMLEELGIRVDYIAGTSMGSFIGALYAIGYSAERIEKIFFAQDWDRIMFNDQISRRSLSIVEKSDDGKYVRTFPIRNWKIALPSGLNPGQSLSAIISRYTWPVNHVNDFSHFPTPFLCIATDIEKGEAVVLESGFLPDAIRASMAFPSVLSPIELNGRLLVDGGLNRNFPVKDLKDRGADIVIGVDVSARLYEKNELNTVLKILEQIASYEGAASTIEQRSLCDILITPDIEGYDASRFDAIDILYQHGEEAVHKVLPQLEALAESQKSYSESTTRFIPLTTYSPINVKEVKVQGLNKVSEYLLYGILQITANSQVSPEELEAAIDRVYGSQYFERVNYLFEPVSGGVNLVIRVTERNFDQFRFGLHYDSDMRSAVLLNTTLRNKIGQGSRLSFRLSLSENLSLLASYFIYTGWKPGLGLELNFGYQNFEVPLRDPELGVITALMDYSVYVSNISIQTILSNSHAIGAVAERSYSKADPIFTSTTYDAADSNPNLLNFYLFGRLDTYDRAVFPTKGLKLYSEVKVITDEYITSKEKSHRPVNRIFLTMNHVFKVSETISWFYGLHTGAINRLWLSMKKPFVKSNYVPLNEIPSDYLFWIGGRTNFEGSIFPFIGLNFMEYSGKDAAVFRIGLQVEPWKDKFIILTANRAFLKEKIIYESLTTAHIKKNVSVFGYGLTVGMNSPIGPMEYTLMTVTGKDDILTHLSIGYWF